MAKLPTKMVARTAACGVFTLLGAALIGSASIAEAGVPVADSSSAHPASFQDFKDVQDPDLEPAPLIQDPPGVQGPSNPGQKTLTPQHRRSRHRAPTST
jgi:hypothetical protein